MTHDAGAHWAARTLPVHVPGLSLPGCVVGDASAPCYTAGPGGVILRTTNGTRFVPAKAPARKDLDGITCVTASGCYAVGAAGTIEVLRAG